MQSRGATNLRTLVSGFNVNATGVLNLQASGTALLNAIGTVQINSVASVGMRAINIPLMGVVTINGKPVPL